MAPDVEAACGLGSDQHARVVATSRAITTFCWFPPESAWRPVFGPAAADVELLEQPRGARDQPARAQPAEARVRRPVEVVEREVLGERELEDEPAPLAILGNVPDAGVEDLVRASAPVRSRPAIETLPRSIFRRPVSASTSSVWPLPSTPAIPTISPARTSNETPRTALELAVVEHVEVLDVEQRLLGLGGRLLDAEEHVAPDHQPRQLCLGGTRGGQRLDLLAAPEHGDPVGDLEHLVQLVADEDDRHPLADEVPEDAEELERLLRREHRRRLVEDEDVRAAGRAP